MLWTTWLGLAGALLGTGKFAADTVYHDPDTGLVFTSNFELYKTDGHGITVRIAIPDNVQSYTAFDAVIQMVIPNEVGWAGLAWGGSMTNNPLLVAWRGTSNNPVLSPRWASSHVQPQPYSGAQYTLFKTGTKTNATHTQFTALCKGCTSWTASDGSTRYLSPRGGNRLAFAYSPTRPASPNSPTSSLSIHEVVGYWQHDFSQAANANFEATVSKLVS
ncbi:edc10232-e76d-4a7e-9954-40ff2686b0aa [Thermothielavioides terrestris]|uniref:Edc10232-e76d-4a7e-9954-40ff2686b0aa n=1 Tax=Thermothielavioides terrestris TaxID=2587410 RepID=A0A3S4AKD9_9PEZI|nr:edc10232-e76d-4a7e-9954-40ff2686b0aa [Thermothielavioides terrestris]